VNKYKKGGRREEVGEEGVLADKACDHRANFDFFNANHIKPAIKDRSSPLESNGCIARKLVLIE